MESWDYKCNQDILQLLFSETNQCVCVFEEHLTVCNSKRSLFHHYLNVFENNINKTTLCNIYSHPKIIFRLANLATKINPVYYNVITLQLKDYPQHVQTILLIQD